MNLLAKIETKIRLWLETRERNRADVALADLILMIPPVQKDYWIPVGKGAFKVYNPRWEGKFLYFDLPVEFTAPSAFAGILEEGQLPEKN